ncbi:hypothetical protein D9611_002853, partial [Ephemerocybe angulata]
MAVEPAPGKDWQLESTIIELSPSTVGPAVGKSIRRLYTSLADGLDVEAARRFAEWFAVHMSNFGFQWVWKEWVPDLELTVQHPKRAFMRRAIEFEIRLAYHERIFKTLPEQMQAADAYTIPDNGPTPAFEYEDPGKFSLFRIHSLSLLNAEDVITHLDTLRESLESSDEPDVDSTVRSIAVQSLLHIGSRSFSHLLNAIERYLPLLRNLAGGGASSTTGVGGSAEARTDILAAAAAFWKHNRQMVAIVFDKLMQYQIVDPTDGGVDVPQWVGYRQLSEVSPMNLSAFEWDLLRAAIDKANGRVVSARRKVVALRKEDDDTRAKAKAGSGLIPTWRSILRLSRRVSNLSLSVHFISVAKDTNERTDQMNLLVEEADADSPQLVAALKAYSSLTKEQRMALSKTLEGFISCLAPSSTAPHPNPQARTVVSESAWENRAN